MARSSKFLTVGTVGYTPQAVATLRSARRHGMHSSFHFFAVDATVDAVVNLQKILRLSDDWISVFGPYDLGPEQDVFLKAFKYYNVIELCCLAKFIGISHVLRDHNTDDICVYADCDILFMGDVNALFNDMGQSAIFLTPHRFGPGSEKDEYEHLLQGWINAGFIIFHRGITNSCGVLDWLIHRISRWGFFAPESGLMCDQKWLSSLPFLFNDLTFVSEHPGLNVAYWNLDERELTDSGTMILANGVPLLFFHFSGFDWTCGTLLSKHSNLLVPRGSVIEKVCRLYQSELAAAVWLQSEVAGLKTIACSKSNLRDRIYVGSVLNGVNIISPIRKIGLFSRVGMKLDSLLCRVMAYWGGKSGN